MVKEGGKDRTPLVCHFELAKPALDEGHAGVGLRLERGLTLGVLLCRRLKLGGCGSSLGLLLELEHPDLLPELRPLKIHLELDPSHLTLVRRALVPDAPCELLNLLIPVGIPTLAVRVLHEAPRVDGGFRGRHRILGSPGHCSRPHRRCSLGESGSSPAQGWDQGWQRQDVWLP